MASAKPVVKMIWKNHGLDATWTATNYEPTMPPRNLRSHVRGNVVRSTGLTAPWRLVADFGTAKAVEAVAVIFDTRPGAFQPTTSATITLKSNTTDSWGAPADSFSLTPWDVTNTGVLLALLGETWNRQFLAVEITDAGNPAGYYEVGLVYAGPLYTFPRSASPAELRFALVDPSPVSYAPAQTPHTEERRTFGRLTMEWTYVPTAHVFGTLQTVLREVGRKRDSVLSVYSGDPAEDDTAQSLNLLGRFTDIPDFEHIQMATGGDYGPSGAGYNWGPVVYRESR